MKATKTMTEALNNFFEHRLAAARNPECTNSAVLAKESTHKLAVLLTNNPVASDIFTDKK